MLPRVQKSAHALAWAIFVRGDVSEVPAHFTGIRTAAAMFLLQKSKNREAWSRTLSRLGTE
jgi:hypothetical protein